MKFINDAPVADSQSVTISSLKLGDVVVTGVGIGRNFLDLPHNPLLPCRRQPGKRLGECLRGYDRIHQSIVTVSNSIVKRLKVTIFSLFGIAVSLPYTPTHVIMIKATHPQYS